MEMPIYRFAGCELDPVERRLIAHGQAITLTPKVFDTLVLLVEHAGHVVSKDELMRTLWPRGFVHESNLTKHIWLIRKALGDSEHEARCIETVPKLGYRFVAPVEAEMRADSALRIVAGASAGVVSSPAAAPEESSNPVTPAPAPTPRTRAVHPAASALIAIALIAVAALAWRFAADEPAITTPRTGTAVAIVDFNNLSQNAKDAWLGPALVEMLGVEIAIGDRVFVLPDELVRPARAGLATPLAGGYAAQTLATLKKRVGADYVLSGSYLVGGTGDAPTLRVDLALQDAASGKAAASVSQSGLIADITGVVARTGAALRSAAGFPAASAATLQSIAHVQPPNVDVARRVGFALDALHRNDPARARDELLDAIAQAPGYAPAYSYLAQAWSALGYGAKAAAAAEQAAAHAEGLPEEQRLHIELQRQATQNAWQKAAVAARALVAQKPENPDYRLRLVQLLLSAHDVVNAEAALAELRKLPDSASDPRTELVAADIASARADVQGAADHARRALALAEARDAPGQIADAQTHLGMAIFYLGQNAEAETVLRQAVATYQRDGNPHGEGSAREGLGKALAAASRGDAAREEYQRAMAIYQSIGDLAGMTTAYSDLARMLWTAGDRDGAQTAARRVLELSHETGDLRMQKWGLQALAIADSDEAAGDDVVKEFEEAIALGEKMDDQSADVWAVANYADVLRMRGDLEQAAAVCRRGEQSVKRVGDPQFTIVITFNCAQIALDRGDIAAAEEGLTRAMAIAKSANDPLMQANVEMTVAQIEMGRHQWSEARARLEGAADTFTKAEATTGSADAQGLLALAADALGDTGARDRAAARAKELRRGINARQEVLVVDLALAELRAHSGDRDAISDLRALADDAERRHWLGWALEIRLATVEVLRQRHDATAEVLASEVASTARAKGFRWVLARLGEAPKTALATPR